MDRSLVFDEGLNDLAEQMLAVGLLAQLYRGPVVVLHQGVQNGVRTVTAQFEYKKGAASALADVKVEEELSEDLPAVFEARDAVRHVL